MITQSDCYVIVNERDEILLSTAASNQQAAWENFMEKANYRCIYPSREAAKRRGFRCVRASIQSEHYNR